MQRTILAPLSLLLLSVAAFTGSALAQGDAETGKAVAEQRLFDNDDPGLLGMPTLGVARTAGNQDGRQLNSVAPEPSQKFEAGHVRQVIVKHQAPETWQVGILQNCLGIAIDPDGEAFDLETELERVEHCSIVVHDQQDRSGRRRFVTAIHCHGNDACCC